MKYLLDTCVISELIAKTPNPNVVEFVDAIETDNIFLSAITIGEIAKGIEKLPESKRKRELQTWLKEDLLVRFDDKVLPLDTEVLIQWGILSARLEGTGITLPSMDSLIAATALTHNLTLITRNEGDFQNTGIEIITPW